MIKEFLLGKSGIYQTFQDIVGAGKVRQFIVKELELKPGCKILDIGCGTADILEHLPEDAQYTGFDPNEKYIDHAQKRFKGRGHFYCGMISKETLKNKSIEYEEFAREKFNIILALGVLHHLNDDEVCSLFELVKNLLLPKGVFLSFDGCYTDNQSPIARLMLDMDRGKFVRTEDGYLQLAEEHFNKLEHKVINNLINIPYTHIVLKGKNI
jgi:cyclopropane fatty-acyl-phospholipid synthase-like methyltransferase